MNAPSHSSEKDLLPDASAALDRRIRYLADNNLTAWGIDFNSKTIDLTILSGVKHPPPTHLSTEPISSDLAPAERIHAYFSAAVRCFLFHGRAATPGVIAVERPAGRHVHPILLHVQAAILIALVETLPPTTIIITSPSEWKQKVMTSGQATKEDTVCWVQDTFKHNPKSFDEADSIGIATFARHEIEKAAPCGS